MGSWHIIIHGHGIHHNDKPDDADNLLREFVHKLRGEGHMVHSAGITVGTHTDVTAASRVQGTETLAAGGIIPSDKATQA
jgi:hypothetical protein